MHHWRYLQDLRLLKVISFGELKVLKSSITVARSFSKQAGFYARTWKRKPRRPAVVSRPAMSKFRSSFRRMAGSCVCSIMVSRKTTLFFVILPKLFVARLMFRIGKSTFDIVVCECVNPVIPSTYAWNEAGGPG